MLRDDDRRSVASSEQRRVSDHAKRLTSSKDQNLATHDHCANHPCSVTAPSGVVNVVSGKPPAAQGFPGLVENRLSSSEGESAPSRSWSNSSKMSVKNW